MKSGTVKDHGHAYKYLVIYLRKALNIAMVKNIEVMLEQTLNPSVWNSVILCSVISF
jgi:hypothetical protein